MTTVAPSPRLAPYVRELVIVETSASAASTASALLPEPGLLVSFRYRGFAEQLDRRGLAHRVADAALTGITSSLRRMRTAPDGGIVVAKLRATGAAALFAQPLHELFGIAAPLDELVPRADVARTRDRLADATTATQRIAAVEDFLWSRRRVTNAAAAPEPDLLVARAVHEIRRTGGRIRIRALAAELGISQDPLEKRFRRVVGASPKQLASIVRLRGVIAAYRPGCSLTQLAHQAGYFDQAHFIRDFRAVVGEAPARFLQGGAYW